MHDTMKCSKWSALLLGVVAAILLAGSGAALAATFDLWAKAGSTTLPGGASVPVWGYTTSAGGTVTAPGGPTLIVIQGDTVTVNLTNDLPQASAMLFQGQDIVPDLSGAAASGGTKTYTFTATNPGTFLYEAGLLPNAQHQAAMGLYGALIVRPATATQAYDAATTAFDDEAVLVLSELDPALAASPATFDMRNYAPKYFLINGKAYPATDPIAISLPDTNDKLLLLRYVNAGIQHHSMAILGLRQNFVAKDASLLPTLTHNVAAETLAPGQTADAIATIHAPTSAMRFPVYDGSLMLHNNGAAGYGGMLTFITRGTGTTDTGPTTSGITLNPNPTGGPTGPLTVFVTATVSDVASGNSNVIAAEYFIDTPGAAGTPMNGTFDSPTVAVSVSISAAQLSLMTSGKHTIYVRGQDANNNWGGFSAATLTVDIAGPITSGLTLTPNPSSGAVSVALSGTGNDTTTGNSNVVAAEYTINGGPPVAMNVNVAAPVAALSATIPAGLLPGSYTVAVRSKDALGNWGANKTITLNVIAGGPVTSNVVAARNPNNGALPLNAGQAVVRVTATAVSTGSTVAAAEGFIDTPPASVNVRGFVFIPSDGAFSTATEAVYADIGLTTINALSTGNHTIFVRSKDAAGNWGGTATTILVIDRTLPTVSAAVLTPAASNNTAVTISATAADTTCVPSICVAAGGEYYIDAVGAPGSGGAMTAATPAPTATISGTIPAASIAALSAGNHTVYVRARDAAGNWSAGTASATLLIDRTSPTFSSITLTPNSIAAGTPSVGLGVNGATDPLVAGLASGVAGGEWWIGTTNIAAGTGTAFAGLTTSVATGSLTACTYTVRTRIRDVAGNWSTGNNGVRTATLTVTGAPSDAIFSDSFETGTLNPLTGWSSVSTTTSSRLNVSAAAAMAGTYGLQAQGNNTNYVQYDFGACPPAAPTFDARFYFNPHGFVPNAGGANNNQDIFVARTTGGTTVFRVRYRSNAGTPQVQIQVGTSTANGTWININNNASNRIEVVWQAVGSGGPSPGTLAIYVNGAVAQQTLNTTSSSSVGGVRLGSVTDAGNNGNTTLEYFDGFAAKRSVSPLIGP